MKQVKCIQTDQLLSSYQGVKTKTIYLKITFDFFLLFGIVFKDLNYMHMI